MKYVRSIPEIAALMEDADHLDVQSIESDKPLRAFVAAGISYMPGWMRFLYRVRALFVRLLGMRQNGFPGDTTIGADDISFTPGAKVGFFTVTLAREGEYWVAGAVEKHLAGYIAIVAERPENGAQRYHLLTVVRYRNWAGPVYFNVIRPFHYLVVRGMMRFAAGA